MLLSPSTGAADAPRPRSGDSKYFRYTSLSFSSSRSTSSDGSIVAARPEDCRSDDIIAMAVYLGTLCVPSSCGGQPLADALWLAKGS